MVARWNRLFPDRRDFSNLATLPIPIRDIFLANFAALLGLAVLFGLVVNAVSSLLFPFFVTMSIGTAAAFFRVGAAHAAAVFSASLFSVFAVFALVGLLSLFVPRRLLKPVSLVTRILLVVGLLSEFFSNLLIQLFAGHLPGAAGTYMQWVPSFWFLGLYETMVGITKPQMVRMAQQALLMLAGSIIVSTAAYAVCYRRIFVRRPESFDMLTTGRPFFRIRLPEAFLKPLFRSQFERGCTSFAMKVLLRSEPHLMFFGAYLGIGLVIVAQTALSSSAEEPRNALPSSAYLSVPPLIAFFVASGLRFVFDTAAFTEANWVFKVAAGPVQPRPGQIARRLLLLATLPWEIAVFLPLTVLRMGWPAALLHIGAVVALTILFTDLLVLGFRKVPFTCVSQVDIRRMIAKMLATIFGVLVIVPSLAAIERWMLEAPYRFGGFALVLAGCWYGLRKYRGSATRSEEGLLFEDGPGPDFELLKLS